MLQGSRVIFLKCLIHRTDSFSFGRVIGMPMRITILKLVELSDIGVATAKRIAAGRDLPLCIMEY